MPCTMTYECPKCGKKGMNATTFSYRLNDKVTFFCRECNFFGTQKQWNVQYYPNDPYLPGEKADEDEKKPADSKAKN